MSGDVAPTGTTSVADPEVWANWQQGPRWYHVIVAMIDDESVEVRRRRVVDLLGDWLEPTTPGQPHVTLWAAGFPPDPTSAGFPVTLPGRRDRRIQLTITGAATFQSAAYLEVSGPSIQRLRNVIARSNAPEDPADRYVPHVTVGRYTDVRPLQEVRSRLALTPADPLTVPAVICHMCVDTRSVDGRLVPPPHMST